MARFVFEDEATAAAPATPAGRFVFEEESAPVEAYPMRWVQKVGEGLLPGYNRVAAAVDAGIVDPLTGDETFGQTFGERYTNRLRGSQAMSRETAQEHPYVSAVLQTAGAVPTALATGGTGTTANALGQATRLSRAVQGLKTGAGYGAAYGAGDAPADAGVGTVAAHTVGGAVLGGVVGAGMGALLPSHTPNRAVLEAAKANNAEVAATAPITITQQPNRLRRVAELTVKPTPEAEYLRAEGVPLTAGQLNPRSAVGQIEEASTSLRYTGPAIAARREAARDAWRGRLLREPVKPGDTKPLPRDVTDAMVDIYGRFGPEYDAIRGQPIPGEALRDMSASASKVLKGVDERTRAGVKAEIENALTVIGYKPTGGGHAHGKPEAPKGLVDAFGREIPATPAPLKPATAGDVLKVRENIRTAIRDARQAQDFDKLRLLEHAEDVVTETLNAHLSPEAATALRATDKRYAIYNMLEDAAGRAGLGGNFTPKQAGAALKKSLGRRAFVHGKGGDVRQLVDAGNAVFESVSPPTGARLLTVGPLGEWLTGPLVWRMNQPRPVPSMPVPPNALVRMPPGPLSLAAAMQRGPVPYLPPGYAEDQ